MSSSQAHFRRINGAGTYLWYLVLEDVDLVDESASAGNASLTLMVLQACALNQSNPIKNGPLGPNFDDGVSDSRHALS